MARFRKSIEIAGSNELLDWSNGVHGWVALTGDGR